MAAANSNASTDALPFLEDTITHLVGREQVALSRRHKVPKSRVRAQAVRHALLGHGMGSDNVLGWKENKERRGGDRDTMVRNDEKESNTSTVGEMSSLVQQANTIIAVVSAIEQKVPLTLDQRLRISHALVDSFSNSKDNRVHAEIKTAGERPNTFTPASAWQAISFLLSDCLLSQEEAAEVLATAPLIATTRMTQENCLKLRSAVDCLRLLEIDDGVVSEIIVSYPEILFGDVDQDMLPMLAYLSDLGLREGDMANIVKKYPQIFQRDRMTKLQAGVAFWVGKGLSKASILKLVKDDPAVLDINKRVMQVKVDWLLEHTELSIEEFVEIPIALSKNLGAFTAPRVAFAREKGWSISEAMHQMDRPTRGNEGDDKTMSIRTVLENDVLLFLQALGASVKEFDEFVKIWYQKEFIPWLERKNKSTEILLQMENEFDGIKMQEKGLEENIAMQKELAWEQQQEREREWHLAWQEWKRGQENMLVAERAARRIEKKNQYDLLRNHRNLLSREDRDDIFRQSLASGANNCIKSPLCSREFGHSGICNRQLANEFDVAGGTDIDNVDLFWDSRLPEKAIGDAISFLGRTWACDSTIEQALAQAIKDSRDMKEPKEDTNADEVPNQSIERVQSCAINLLLLLKASDYGILEPIIFYAWAERSGVTRAELIAAKALISKTKSAFVRPEPSWKYYKVPSRVWMLPDAQLYAPNLLPLRLKTKGSQSVSKLADTIYECMLNNPYQALTRREIADMCSHEMDAQSKKVRFAVAMLLEQGLVAQRRRKGITSGPMELLLVDISRYEDYGMHNI